MADRMKTATKGLPYHPLADIFPLIEGAEFEEMVADLKARKERGEKNVLLEKIVLHEGKILDGRNRYRACIEADLFKPGSDAKVHIRDTTHFVVLPANQNVIEFVVSKNIHRRHFKEGQRAYFAAELANMRVGGKDTNSANLQNWSQERAAKVANVSTRSVASAAKVIENGVREIVEAVRDGKLAPSAAAQAVDLSPADQKEIAVQAKRGDKKAVGRKIKEAKASKTKSTKSEKNTTKKKCLLDELAVRNAVDALSALRWRHLPTADGSAPPLCFSLDQLFPEKVNAALEMLAMVKGVLLANITAAEDQQKAAAEAAANKRANAKPFEEAIAADVKRPKRLDEIDADLLAGAGIETGTSAVITGTEAPGLTSVASMQWSPPKIVPADCLSAQASA
jgi:hypothetical protein